MRVWRTAILGMGMILGASVAGAQPREEETTTWAQGTVRDEAGRPVAGARVFFFATYYGSIRMYEIVRKGVADADGKYAVQGKGGLSSFSATLVAHTPGHPPALAWLRFPEPERDSLGGIVAADPKRAAPQVDFVIPARGGNLEVAVLRDGRPAADVGVELSLQSASLRDQWAREDPSPERAEVVALFRPLRRSGPDGVARFDQLLPGCYTIYAAPGDDQNVRSMAEQWIPFGRIEPWGQASGVAVRQGETSRHQLEIYSQPGAVRFAVLRHDLKPLQALPMDRVIISYGMAHGRSMSSTSIKLNDNGTGSFRFERGGLVRVHFPYKETPILSSPISRPYWSADGIVAVSPRISDVLPVVLTAAENRGGTIVVRLADGEGKALAGLAAVRNYPFKDAGPDGARFEGITPGTYVAQGRHGDVPRLVLDKDSGPLPADEALAGRSELLPQRVVVDDIELRDLTLRVNKVGYVRGNLRPPKGHSAAEYHVTLSADDYQLGRGIAWRPESGEFVAGPFTDGPVVLRILDARNLASVPLTTQEVVAAAGRVVKADLSPPPVAPEIPESGQVFIGMGGISQLKGGQGPGGQVLLADGTTPALGAMVLTFRPAVWQPTSAGMTDALGIVRPRWYWLPQEDSEIEPPGSPREPVAVAWQPGHSGAAIMPLPQRADQPLKITLPAPIAVKGRVSIGGGEAIGAGRVQVLAEHVGHGKLDGLLSVETTAEADGAFELAGLTPGKYRVQAALDGIWLSPSIEVAASDQPAAPLALTIATPGGPVLVRLKSPPDASAPLKVRVDRPAGPLHDRLWPQEFLPDGAGVVRIPALEAGVHTLRMGEQTTTVAVPTLNDSGGRPVEISMPR